MSIQRTVAARKHELDHKSGRWLDTSSALRRFWIRSVQVSAVQTVYAQSMIRSGALLQHQLQRMKQQYQGASREVQEERGDTSEGLIRRLRRTIADQQTASLQQQDQVGSRCGLVPSPCMWMRHCGRECGKNANSSRGRLRGAARLGSPFRIWCKKLLELLTCHSMVAHAMR